MISQISTNYWNQIHEHSCFKKGTLPARNVSPLMPINCLINCLINQRVEETKRQSDKKGERQKPRKPLEEYGGCAAAVMLPFWSYKSKLLTPNRQHPRAFFQKAAILFKAINRNKPFNGSAMNSPPTPPYCGSVAAALHLMNSQIRCK